MNNEKPKKPVTIIVNGRSNIVEKEEISFSELVNIAFGVPGGTDTIIFTITYTRGHGNKPEGSLVEGESVKVKEGMVFNVSRTDKS